MILNAIAAKLKGRIKDDFEGRHFEATLIVRSWHTARHSSAQAQDDNQVPGQFPVPRP